MMLEAIGGAILHVLQPSVLFATAIGTIIGIIIGALPGLTVTMGMALLAPFTFFMDPVVGISMLIGLYKGGTFGGSISAVLIGTPGTASNAATMLDGFAMAQRGEGSRALGASLTGSVIGDFFGSICLVIGAPLLASIALKFGSPEFFALTAFAVTMVCYVSGRSLAKGLMAAGIGFALALIGTDPIGGSPRLTFGMPELSAGIGVLPLAIGLFGFTEVLVQLESYAPIAADKLAGVLRFDFRQIFDDIRAHLRTVFRSALIGTIIGALPGIGAETSNWVAYGLAKRASRTPETFGRGNVDGVIAPEVAANAVCGAAIVPMLIFGIPGDIVTAIMMGALIGQGLQPGPNLIAENPTVFYSLFANMFLSMLMLAFFGFIAVKFAGRILSVPRPILFAAVALLCVAGTYAVGSSLFDVGMMMAFGFLGYLMRKLDIPVPPLVLAFILSRLIEQSFRLSLIQGDGTLLIFVQRPIAAGFLALTAAVVAGLLVQQWRAWRGSKVSLKTY
jgi:putative tricarboxylic transport membrane protein